MIEKLLKFFDKTEANLDLTDEQKQYIEQETARTNLQRLRVGASVAIVVELLLIVFIDIPAIQTSSDQNLWIYQSYLLLHGFLLLLGIVGFLWANYLLKHPPGNFAFVESKVIFTAVVLILSAAAIITGLDQISTGQVTAYVFLLLIISVLFLISWPTVVYAFAIPHTILVISLIVFQDNSILLQANIANSTIFLITILFINKLLYDKNYNDLAKNLLLSATNDKLNYLVQFDELTGLLNRRSFLELAQFEMENVRSNENKTFLVLIDIDHFKHVNDTYGHPVGDRVIQKFASLLKDGIRTHDHVARWGGEEFILLFPNTSLLEVEKLSNQLRVAIEETIMTIDTIKIQVTASFGVAELNCDVEHFHIVFSESYKLADTALYKAKHNGRNKVILT